MKTASAACSRSCLMLPDIKQMLHCQADNRYAEPADKTEQDRLPPVLISLTKLVLRPIAAIAMAIINLPMAGKNWKKSKWEPAKVLIIDAPKK